MDKARLDISKAGSYKIKVTAADKYKNKVTKKTTVNVVTMEVAEKDGVTSTVEGIKPQSKNLEEKVAKEEAEKAANEQQQTSNTYTHPSNTGGSSGTTPPASNACTF